MTVIRRLKEQEAPLLAAVRSAVGNESPGPFGYRQQNATVLLVSQEFLRPGYAAFGAFNGGVLVGAASVAPTPTVPDWYGLFSVAVLPEFRGNGLSRKLVVKCLDYARSCGAEGVTLEVNVPNPAAKGLYDSLGFETWNECQKAYCYDGVHYTELSMRKFLGPR